MGIDMLSWDLVSKLVLMKLSLTTLGESQGTKQELQTASQAFLILQPDLNLQITLCT